MYLHWWFSLFFGDTHKVVNGSILPPSTSLGLKHQSHQSRSSCNEHIVLVRGLPRITKGVLFYNLQSEFNKKKGLRSFLGKVTSGHYIQSIKTYTFIRYKKVWFYLIICIIFLFTWWMLSTCCLLIKGLTNGTNDRCICSFILFFDFNFTPTMVSVIRDVR